MPGAAPSLKRFVCPLMQRNHPADATAATNVRDLRDWTRATSLPAADGDRTPTEFPIADSVWLTARRSLSEGKRRSAILRVYWITSAGAAR